jgi:phosphate transport system substrate-binding protein
MKRVRGWAVAASALLAFGMAGCGGTVGVGPSAGQATRLNAGGSSFVYPLMQKWASEYDKSKGVQVNYQSIGSGGGIQQMTAKTFDFGCTDGPMNEEQLQAAKKVGGDVVHVPLAMGAAVLAYNLDEVQEPLIFSGPVLADIYLGKIKKWNDKALQDLNPSVKLPAKDIGVFHRSDGSGTTYIFTDYLSKVSPDWKQKVGTATSVDWPTGEGAKGSEGVSGRVKATPGAICYVELIYALQNGIKFGKVQNKEGNAVTPDLKSVTAAAENALTNIPDDLRYSITNAGGKDSYPISGTVWAVLYVQQPADRGQAVVDYLRWSTHDGQQFCEGLKYAKLPSGLVQRVDKKLDSVQVGK